MPFGNQDNQDPDGILKRVFMVSIAVTGGIACGKSLFCKFLSSMGAETVDTDAIVKGLHEPGMKGAKSVESVFGSEFLLPSGATDRAALGALVFSDESALKRLEDILHPLVKEELSKWREKSGAEVKVAQIPLLFEKGWDVEWDVTVCVTAPEDVRMSRLLARGLTKDEAEKRISAQMTSAQKAALADIVINNDGTETELEATARELLTHLENK